MNYSFYGGRRGASFIIAARFNSEAEMIAAFKQGGNYTAVNYDEFVIIDTPNKNDKDNGKIYRRGYNYQDNLEELKKTISKIKVLQVWHLK